MLTTRTPRGRGVRRFKFLPLTDGEIEALQFAPSRAADHLNQCSCGKNGDSRRVLEKIADLLVIALQHGLSAQEAWELVREQHALLPDEEDEPDLPSLLPPPASTEPMQELFPTSPIQPGDP